MSGIVTDPTPIITPVTGLYTESFNVTIASASAGAIIYYSIDGSLPSMNSSTSSKYLAPLQITDTTVVKAIAYVGGTSSNIATVTYTMGTNYVIVPEGSYGFIDGTEVVGEELIEDGALSVYNDALLTSYGLIDLTDATTTSFRYRLLADTWEEQDDGMTDDVQLAAMYKALVKATHLVGGSPEMAQLANAKYKELEKLIRVQYNTTKHLNGAFKQVSF